MDEKEILKYTSDSLQYNSYDLSSYNVYDDQKKITYHEQTDIDNILKLREVLKTLPDFCRDYFRAMDPLMTTKTRISYAYDIRIFFQFLLD